MFDIKETIKKLLFAATLLGVLNLSSMTEFPKIETFILENNTSIGVTLWTFGSKVSFCQMRGFAVLRKNKVVEIWNLQTKECTAKCASGTEYFLPINVSNISGLKFMVIRERREYGLIVKLWDPRTNSCFHEFVCCDKDCLVEFSSDGRFMISSEKSFVNFWNLCTKTWTYRFDCTSRVCDLSISQNCMQIVAKLKNGKVITFTDLIAQYDILNGKTRVVPWKEILYKKI